MAIHCLVSGRVQGVSFRWFTKEVADKLGVTGWVRNLTDGRVELIAIGSDEQLEQLELALRNGPPMAAVEDLFFSVIDYQPMQAFSISPTAEHPLD